jgi:acetyl esterase/lipase
LVTVNARDVLTRATRPPDETLRYGEGPEQVADVWLPQRPGPAPVALFLHGGFWRAQWDRTHARPVAEALAAAGFVACLPEYRRTGGGGGWPGTFDDIAAAVDILPGRLAALWSAPEPPAVVLAGHSAGGHLALWAAARRRFPDGARWQSDTPIRGVVALAPVSDLADCQRRHLDGGAAEALVGGPPEDHPDRYAAIDPARLLPLGVPVGLLHGSADRQVPVEMSRAYLAAARAAGDAVEFAELADRDHFALIDPESAAWPRVLAAFAAAAGQ